jgi:hypothetical protein
MVYLTGDVLAIGTGADGAASLYLVDLTSLYDRGVHPGRGIQNYIGHFLIPLSDNRDSLIS